MLEIAAPDLASPTFKDNPHPFYAHLREESPVWRTTLPDNRTAWLVTRYEDVAGELKDKSFAKDPLNAQDPEQRARDPWVPGFLKPLEKNMLDLDEPEHRRLRTLVSKAFTPRLIERLRGRVEAICQELLDAMEHEGRAELVRDYALPLPATVIAELLGIPADDHRKFHRWSNRIVSISSGRDVWRALPAAVAFVRYLRKMSERRRISPEDDLISALIRAEEEGDKLSQDELLAMSFLLLVAGHETTVNLIASGMLALMEYPDQLDELKSDPQLIKPGVEELLRCTSPVEIATERYATRDLENARDSRFPVESSRSSVRPTATSSTLTSLAPSFSVGPPTSTWPSGVAACIIASARLWPECKVRSPSPRSCNASPTSAWPPKPNRYGGTAA